MPSRVRAACGQGYCGPLTECSRAGPWTRYTLGSADYGAAGHVWKRRRGDRHRYLAGWRRRRGRRRGGTEGCGQGFISAHCEGAGGRGRDAGSPSLVTPDFAGLGGACPAVARKRRTCGGSCGRRYLRPDGKRCCTGSGTTDARRVRRHLTLPVPRKRDRKLRVRRGRRRSRVERYHNFGVAGNGK